LEKTNYIIKKGICTKQKNNHSSRPNHQLNSRPCAAVTRFSPISSVVGRSLFFGSSVPSEASVDLVVCLAARRPHRSLVRWIRLGDLTRTVFVAALGPIVGGPNPFSCGISSVRVSYAACIRTDSERETFATRLIMSLHVSVRWNGPGGLYFTVSGRSVL